MSKSKNYKELLHARLKSPEEAAAYLNAALEDDDPGVFLVALKDIAEANGGMTHIARESHLNRETLYRTLSKRGNPTLANLRSLLSSIGLEIAINPSVPHKNISPTQH
jgi:probable addiction module antidote protein